MKSSKKFEGKYSQHSQKILVSSREIRQGPKNNTAFLLSTGSNSPPFSTGDNDASPFRFLRIAKNSVSEYVFQGTCVVVLNRALWVPFERITAVINLWQKAICFGAPFARRNEASMTIDSALCATLCPLLTPRDEVTGGKERRTGRQSSLLMYPVRPMNRLQWCNQRLPRTDTTHHAAR